MLVDMEVNFSLCDEEKRRGSREDLKMALPEIET